MKKPYGYWTLDKTLDEYVNVSEQLQHPVTITELKKSKRWDLIDAIRKSGGMEKIRALAGYDNPTRPRGYWTLDNTIEEYSLISKQLGHPATYTKIKRLERNDLLGGIDGNGGINRIRAMYLGQPYKPKKRKRLPKPNGYWTEENTAKEYKILSDRLGHPVTQQELKELDRGDLLGGIQKNGGLYKIKELTGYNGSTRPRGYWTKERVVKEYKLVSNELDHPPTQQELKELKRQDLLTGIQKNGGLLKIRKLAGYNNPKKPNGYWTEERVVKEYKILSDKLGHPVTQQELKELKRQDLLGAIGKHRGIPIIRELAGYNNLRKYGWKNSRYWTFENTTREYNIISEQLGHAATGTELKERKKWDILNAIHKNGGMNKIRAFCLNKPYKPTKPPGYWTEERVVQEYKDFSEELGHPATQLELVKLKREDLLAGITKNGGMNKIRALAFNKQYKTKKQKLENLITEYILK